MSDKPIIFSGEMVRALLAGRKSMTRRILKPQPKMLNGGLPLNNGRGSYSTDAGWTRYSYAVGDRLWCREAWRIGAWDFEDSTMCVDFRADGFADKTRRHVADGDWFNTAWQGVSDELRSKGIDPDADGNYRWDVGRGPLRWRHSIHMPRWASRLTLLVTDVRVERLQDISAADAIAEGCHVYANSATIDCDTPDPRTEYRALWNSLHGPDAWAANPWVAAISFTVSRGNIDGGDA